MKKNYYITTTLPYVNAEPHIGFGMEIVAADALARYHRLLGENVVFNTGTDEHGLKIYQKAIESKKDPQEYVDEYAAKFDELKTLLNLSYTNFVRTTDESHLRAVGEFWKRCEKNGDIYKKNYKVKYCVGCELEKSESELVNKRCPLHPDKELEIIEEENYFFRFSKYQEPLLKLYEDNPDFVRPDSKYKEIVSFVEKGLKDFSISRLKSKLPWGIPVPGDEEQVMYVWFDALINYISTLGWPNEDSDFSDFWPGVQIAGKDNLRQQSAMWQAMLLSAGIETSKQVLINGFISIGGKKMSKSLGNVITPQELVDKYTIDGARFLLLDMGPVHEDIDVTWEKLDSRYQSFLANGLGNTVSRVSALCEKSGFDFKETDMEFSTSMIKHLESYRFDLALNEIWADIKRIDQSIEKTQPWTLEGGALKENLFEAVLIIRNIAYNLQPFLPETAKRIIKQFQGLKIVKEESLFPRLT